MWYTLNPVYTYLLIYFSGNLQIGFSKFFQIISVFFQVIRKTSN